MAATWSAVAVADSAARFAAVRTPVSAFAVAADTEVLVALEAAEVVPVIEAQILPLARRDCPHSSPFSVQQPSRQSSSGPVVWHKGVPDRGR